MVHLKRWYRGRHFSRVVRVTPGMVLGTGGTIYRPCLRAKGSESRGLFFSRELNCEGTLRTWVVQGGRCWQLVTI